MQHREAGINWTIPVESMVIGMIRSGLLAMAAIVIASQLGF